MRALVAIDLSQLPPPQLIEALDFESYAAAMQADFRLRWPEFTAVLESEPVVKLIEVFAYRETLVRNRANKAALATMLARAIGSDLDHVGAGYACYRLALVENPRPFLTNPEDWEIDDRYRRRIQLAPEAFSVAGPAGAYEYWALTREPGLFDVSAYAPPGGVARGEVHVVVAGPGGADVADDVVTRLFAMFAGEDIVPLTDVVTVRRAVRRDYAVRQKLQVRRGPDPAIIRADAIARVAAYGTARQGIGETVYRAGFVAASQRSGVENVIHFEPAADVVCGADEIGRCTSIDIEIEVL